MKKFILCTLSAVLLPMASMAGDNAVAVTETCVNAISALLNDNIYGAMKLNAGYSDSVAAFALHTSTGGKIAASAGGTTPTAAGTYAAQNLKAYTDACDDTLIESVMFKAAARKEIGSNSIQMEACFQGQAFAAAVGDADALGGTHEGALYSQIAKLEESMAPSVESKDTLTFTVISTSGGDCDTDTAGTAANTVTAS